jgi:hypothetical protein
MLWPRRWPHASVGEATARVGGTDAQALACAVRAGGRVLSVGESNARVFVVGGQIMGGSASLLGMYGVIYFTGQRIAAVQMAEIAEQEKQAVMQD